MSVLEYSLKFTKLSKYAPLFVFDRRDEMNHFLMEMSDDFQEEFLSAMIHDNINISCLMVHAKEVEDAMAKRKSRYSK